MNVKLVPGGVASRGMRVAASLAVLTVALPAAGCGEEDHVRATGISQQAAERSVRTALKRSPHIETLDCGRRGKQWLCIATDARHRRYSCLVRAKRASCVTGTNVREP